MCRGAKARTSGMDKNAMVFHRHTQKIRSFVSFAQAQINEGAKSGFFGCCVVTRSCLSLCSMAL